MGGLWGRLRCGGGTAISRRRAPQYHTTWCHTRPPISFPRQSPAIANSRHCLPLIDPRRHDIDGSSDAPRRPAAPDSRAGARPVQAIALPNPARGDESRQAVCVMMPSTRSNKRGATPSTSCRCPRPWPRLALLQRGLCHSPKVGGLMLRCRSWPAAGWTSLPSCHIAVETCDTARIQPSTWRIIAARPSPRRPSKPQVALGPRRDLWKDGVFLPLFLSFSRTLSTGPGPLLGGLSRPDQEGMLIVCLSLPCKRHGGERLKRLIQRPRRISTDSRRPPLPPTGSLVVPLFPSLGSVLGVCATCNSSSPIPLVS